MRTVIALAILVFGGLGPIARMACGQVVGGEAVYYDPDSKSSKPAPGVRIYLISGQYSPGNGVPTDGRIRDETYSASTAGGADANDIGTFALSSKDNNAQVTLLYYPYDPNGNPTNPGLLASLVTPKLQASIDGTPKAQVRLNCTTTSARITSEKRVTALIERAYIAREWASKLDYGQDVREKVFQRELAIIASMVDQPDKYPGIIDRSISALKTNGICRQEEIEGISKTLFGLDAKRREEIRRYHLDSWSRIKATDFHKMDFEKDFRK